jgi:hypothetical protein
MNKPLLEILKDLSALAVGAAATLYVFGFTVHLAYFRLLGVEMVGQPLDYMRLAADYFVSVITSLPQLLLDIRYYLPELLHWPVSGAALACLLIVFLLLVLHLPVRGLKDYIAEARLFRSRFRLEPVLRHGLNLLLVVCLCIIIYVEFEVASVRDVFQPVDAADIQQMKAQPIDAPGAEWQGRASLEIRAKNVGRVYRKYMQSKKDSPGFKKWNRWFNPVANPHNAEDRVATFFALLLVNTVAAVALTFQILFFLRKARTTMSPRGKPINSPGRGRAGATAIVLSLVFLFQLLLFCYVYVALRRYYVYPVVSLKLDGPASKGTPEGNAPTGQGGETSDPRTAPGLLDPSWTHCVYLIAQTDSEVVVYDRLNYFQIKHVPRSRILAINQLFHASPFESCSNDEKDENDFQPCEVLWMPETKRVSDF